MQNKHYIVLTASLVHICLLSIALDLLSPRQAWAQEEEDPYAPIVLPVTTESQSANPSNLMNPNISLVGNLLASYHNGQPLPGSQAEGMGIVFQEIELGFQAAVDPYFRVDAFLAIEGIGPELAFEQLELTSLCLPTGLQLQLGQLLAEFGRHNMRHLETWDFADNHLPNRYLLNEAVNATGMEISYLLPTGTRLLMIKLVAQALNGKSDGLAALTGLDQGLGNANQELEWDDIRLAALGRLETAFTMSPSWTLVLGGSFLTGPSGEAGAELDSWLAGVDLYLRYRQTRGTGYTTVSLAAEGMRRRRELGGSELVDDGFYAQLFYRFAQRWNTALRFDWVNGDAVEEVMRSSASLSFLPSEFSRIRLQYNLARSAPTDDLGHEALLQVEFSIGPHGAHAF